MQMKRRSLLKAMMSAAGTLAIGLPISVGGAGASVDTGRFGAALLNNSPSRRLRVLFLGGTNFVGPPIVHYLNQRGHEVTLFNRGLTNPGLFPDNEKLNGDRFPDRGAGISRLQGDRTWDVVIDTWRDNPLAVEATIGLLAGRVGCYTYVSSIAVYGNKNYETVSPITESTPVPEVERPLGFDETPGYRICKIVADQAVSLLEGKGLVFRPHGIYGYYMSEESDGQTYWPVRMSRGGDVLCPGDGQDTMQYVDVLDLATFVVDAIERSIDGVFNVSKRLTFRSFLEQLQAMSPKTSRMHWIAADTFAEHGLKPYSNIPLWVPRNLGPGFFNISDTKAVAAGMSYRPFADTFEAVLAGSLALKGSDYVYGDGILTPEQERLILRGAIGTDDAAKGII